MDDEGVAAHVGAAAEDAIPAVPRAGRRSEDGDAALLALRGAGEPLVEYLERVGDALGGDRVSTEGSAESVRRSRQERTVRLERAVGMTAAGRGVRRDEADAILARLDRAREAIMRGRVFEDDSTALVRRERARRSDDLRRGSDS